MGLQRGKEEGSGGFAEVDRRWPEIRGRGGALFLKRI